MCETEARHTRKYKEFISRHKGKIDLLEILEILSGDETSASGDGELHVGDLSVNVLQELDDKVDHLVLEHRLRVEVRHEEGNVVGLRGNEECKEEDGGRRARRTSTGLRRRMTKFSARCVRKRRKRRARTRSSSSLFLMRTEMRTAFTEPSINTRSSSERAITTGFSKSSGLCLRRFRRETSSGDEEGRGPRFDFRFVVTLDFLRREVLQANGSREGAADGVKVRLQGARLGKVSNKKSIEKELRTIFAKSGQAAKHN